MINQLEPATDIDWETTAAEIALELEGGAAAADREGVFRSEVVDLLRSSGVMQALVPTAVGGGGASFEEMAAVLRGLGRRDASTALTLSMHSHVVAAQVWRHNRGQEAGGFFQKIVDGAFVVTSGASDWVGSSGSAQRVDGGFRITATKMPISGCEVAQVLATTVRYEHGDGTEILHCSLPMAAEGVRVERTWDTLGLRATGSQTVVLEDVFVPDSAVSLRRIADEWHPIWNTLAGCALPLMMSVYAGIADSIVGVAVAAAKRKNDGPTTNLLGELMNVYRLGVDTVDAMVRSAENLHFVPTDETAAIVLSRKTNATEAFLATARLALEVTGGAGFSRGSDLEQLYRDMHGCVFHPLPRARQVELTGWVALGRTPVG